MKRVLSFVLAVVLVCTMIPLASLDVEATTSFPTDIYLKQQTSVTCTLASAAMMLRARMYLSNNSSWKNITESSIKSTAWHSTDGLYWSFTYKTNGNSVSVKHKEVSGFSISSLKDVLDDHPEGIVLYCRNSPHAVFLTGYSGNTFYCADPANSYSGKQITLANSLLGSRYGNQANVLNNTTDYWYISSYSITSNCYVIDFNPNGGTCSTTEKTYSNGNTYGTLPKPTLDGYTFEGWFTSPYSGTAVVSGDKVTADDTLYAHWSRNGDKVNFDTNGEPSLTPVAEGQLNGVNITRYDNYLVLLHNRDATGTNETGCEIAVNAAGKVTAVREYGDTNKLSVPNNGFVLSGRGTNRTFVESIAAMDTAYVGVDFETGTVSVYDSYAAKVAGDVYQSDYAFYEELPVPYKEGYLFDAWYENDDVRVTYGSSCGGRDLSAHWTEHDDAPPTKSVAYNGHYYELYDYHLTWNEAKDFCETRDGHLVTITDADEQATVVALMQEAENGLYYIGATDEETANTWKWVTGETFSYENWDEDLPEPSNKEGEYYSAIMAEAYSSKKDVGDWIDREDHVEGGFYEISNVGFICEYEWESTCKHSYTYEIGTAPTMTDIGTIVGTCSLCEDNKTLTVPALNSTDYAHKIETPPTCEATGVDSYTITVENTSFTFQTITDKTAHTYTSEVIGATCTEGEKIRYTCSVCRDTYEELLGERYSEWSTEKPVGIDDSLIETKTQYRYSDYETTTSYAPSLAGYTQLSSTWEEASSGTIQYVKSWPSGFNTNNSLYSTYNKAPKTASETETEKVVIDSNKVTGYLYYHWCRGEYKDGPINRGTSKTKTSEFDTFHAFYSTTKPSTLTEASDGDGSYKFSKSSCCTDSYWYYYTSVYTQTYTASRKVFTYERWSDWSEWSDTERTASDSRQVETQTLYRYASSSLGEHSYDAVVTAPTCTAQGYTTHTCIHCGDSYEDTYITASGHNYLNGTCSVCGDIARVRGDVNLDSAVDMEDFVALARHIGLVEEITDATALANADVTGEGDVDMSDFVKIAQYIGNVITDLS